MIKIKADVQPVENATLEHVYSKEKLIFVSLTAHEGYELINTKDELSAVSTVMIPAQYSERVSLYKSILKKETEEEI